jgi:Resolvase, N terminal domain
MVLAEALAYARDGDSIVVWKLDRLGRSLKHLIETVNLGPLMGPNGTSAWIRTVWILLTGEVMPRLVTLIPEEKP